jgi:hypothetical protein
VRIKARVRGGLAGARLREPHDVASLAGQRNGLALDGGGAGVAGVADRVEDQRVKPELGEAERRPAGRLGFGEGLLNVGHSS